MRDEREGGGSSRMGGERRGGLSGRGPCVRPRVWCGPICGVALCAATAGKDRRARQSQVPTSLVQVGVPTSLVRALDATSPVRTVDATTHLEVLGADLVAERADDEAHEDGGGH